MPLVDLRLGGSTVLGGMLTALEAPGGMEGQGAGGAAVLGAMEESGAGDGGGGGGGGSAEAFAAAVAEVRFPREYPADYGEALQRAAEELEQEELEQEDLEQEQRVWVPFVRQDLRPAAAQPPWQPQC